MSIEKLQKIDVEVNTKSIDNLMKEFSPKKKTKTPRNYDSILKGALALSFSEKVELRKELSKAIEAELTDVRNQADQYLKLANESK